MDVSFFRTSPRFEIGTYQSVFPFVRRKLTLGQAELASHIHCMGLTGQGKSKLLAHMASSHILQGRACCVIDPHADMAHDILKILLDQGFYQKKDATAKVLYIDFSHKSRFIPFNVLKQPYATDEIARNLVEACTRAWPALADGAAPQFENILLAAAVVLIENGLPITEMTHLLTDGRYRGQLLRNVPDPEIVRFFYDRFDRWGKETPQMIESTLRRVFLLSFSPALRFTLGQADNLLDFRTLMDSQISLIVNLGGLDEQTQRLIGCFLTVGFEQAALSREDLPEKARKDYFLIMDEFSMFSAQSEEALARMLSLARKYRLFVTMAHQTWSQLSVRLQGALQNSLPIYFRLGYDDAVWASPRLGQSDPYHVKHEVKPLAGTELGMEYHPVYFQQQEEYEAWTRRIENLWPQEAYIRLNRHVPRLLQHVIKRSITRKVRITRIPPSKTSQDDLEALRERYAKELLREVSLSPTNQVQNAEEHEQSPPIGLYQGARGTKRWSVLPGTQRWSSEAGVGRRSI